ncbi:hypothetical protein PICMEDRAFT_33343 [Pichia membranifaciens NRRL Y-2026]|uniref:RGS domain-containing protein n=1 Tax=Pichia membranifaciens NRRL Y-2026 TaxID=763406 RepID=A0A1E3NKN5_9ASCO|nr:hypothetical protein PICMEDRAFT_33343 [Pichia membranifaciens NRRL Y-2026]ODQ46681.1 hypothetical protein PICMEDRAFT_33343 [Pichia membranifaciens NRRL Y-2026]
MKTDNTKQKPSSQVSLKTLTRTPAGKVYHHDLKSIYAALLCCLDLKAAAKNVSSALLKLTMKKTQAYSFSVERAVHVMSNLEIDLQYNLTLTKLSYEINTKFAFELLQIFYTAKLLHCPDDRTCKKLTNERQILQPTPKGVAILHQFCLKMGIPNISSIKLPQILKSSFNSMQLIEFERHSTTDSIIHSENSDKLLFIQLMGPSMNVWSSKNGPDPISDLGSLLKAELRTNDHIYGSCEGDNRVNPLESDVAFFEYLKQRQQEQVEVLKECDNYGDEDQPVKAVCSPFYHRFFTNPDSDSHVQYYVSNKGLRFSRKKSITLNSNKKTINNCFSGKALIQCILDCTDVMFYQEALKVATVFIKLKLIKCESFDESNLFGFIPSRDYIYSLTELGYQIVKWNPPETRRGTHSASSSESGIQGVELASPSTISLSRVLKDPALKYLFRSFMSDNVCIENLRVYDDIVDFQKKITILRKMLSLKDREKYQVSALQHKKLTIYTAINKLSEYCLSKVYTIFAMYISEDAPSEINIDSKLRFEVKHLIQNNGEFSSPSMNISELKSLEIPPASPTEVLFGPKLKFLEEVCLLYEEIRIMVYRMMETDSRAKFLASDQFTEYYYSL